MRNRKSKPYTTKIDLYFDKPYITEYDDHILWFRYGEWEISINKRNIVVIEEGGETER